MKLTDLLNEENPCWDGYQQLGMKKKSGKEVPNCVPIEEKAETTEDVVSFNVGDNPIWIKKNDSTHVDVYNSEDNFKKKKGSSLHIQQLSDEKFFGDMLKWLRTGTPKYIQNKTYKSTNESVNHKISDNKFINTLRESINAPFVSVDMYEGKALVKISLDPVKSNFYNKSRFMMFSIDKNGLMEEFGRSYKLKDFPKFISSKVGDASEASNKVNSIVESIKKTINKRHPLGSMVGVINASKYNPISHSTTSGVVEGVDLYGNVIVFTKFGDMIVEGTDITETPEPPVGDEDFKSIAAKYGFSTIKTSKLDVYKLIDRATNKTVAMFNPNLESELRLSLYRKKLENAGK